MPDKSQIMSSGDTEPLYVKFGVEGSKSPASQRTRRVALWAHSLDFGAQESALSDFDPCLRVCPQRMVCEASGRCGQALSRAMRIMGARFMVAQMRVPHTRRA